MRRIAKILLPFFLALAVLVSIVPGVIAASPEETTPAKNFITYFANWDTYSGYNVSNIPWDKVTMIDHAFFKVDDSFKLVSTDDWADFGTALAHSTDQLKGNFGEYAYYKNLYPNVKILVSVGGWSACQNYSAMASTEVNRATFINSVIAFLKEYPFIDGIDIDWEYPGQTRDGVPSSPADGQNYTLLLKEIRAAYNANGMSDKKLTVCAPANTNVLKLVNPGDYSQYVDGINVMAYDIHGTWETSTNNASPLYADPKDPTAADATLTGDYIMKYLENTCKVPASKLNLGVPYYAHGWQNVDDSTGKNGLFAKASGAAPLEQGKYSQMVTLENTAGYVKYFDAASGVSYLYNKKLHIFYTYDDPKTVAEKSQYVLDNGYGGILVWEMSDDTSDYQLTNTIANTLKEPVVNVKSGTYTTAQTVSLLNSVPGSTIYYTTDGSAPTAASTIYTQPLKVTNSTTIKAAAFLNGNISTSVASYTYTFKPATKPATVSSGSSSTSKGSGGTAPGNENNPKTGDNSPFVLSFGLIAAALMLFFVSRRISKSAHVYNK